MCIKANSWKAFCPGIHIPKGLMGQMEKLDKIEDKGARKAKTSELNIDYFAGFIKELRKTTPAVGCHIMAVGFEEIVKGSTRHQGQRVRICWVTHFSFVAACLRSG